MNCYGLDVELLQIVGLVKKFIFIFQILVFVALIIWIMLDVIKTVSSNDADNSKLLKSITRRLIAGALVLLVPVIIKTVFLLVAPSEMQYQDYYDCANDKSIQEVSVYQANAAINDFKRNPDMSHYRKAKDAVSIVSGSERESFEKELKDLYRLYFPTGEETQGQTPSTGGGTSSGTPDGLGGPGGIDRPTQSIY